MPRDLTVLPIVVTVLDITEGRRSGGPNRIRCNVLRFTSRALRLMELGTR